MTKKDFKQPLLKIVHIEKINTLSTSPDIDTEIETDDVNSCHIWGDEESNF